MYLNIFAEETDIYAYHFLSKMSDASRTPTLKYQEWIHVLNMNLYCLS